MQAFNRRDFLIGAGAAGGMGMLAACGGLGGGGGNQAGTLRYAFWGSDVRQQNYSEAFGMMEDEYPDISMNVEFADYNAFQERMTTQMAAGNVADIFWVPAPQVMTYYSNGLYRPLEGIDTLDLSDYSDQDIEDFRLDGEHNTMPFGTFVPVIRYNATFVEEYGADLPDEWTWDEFAEFAIDFSSGNPDGVKALTYDAQADLPFEGWIRQRGEELWTEDGQIGFSQETLEEWIEWWENLREAGATTSIGEQDGIEGSWEDIGDIVLMRFGNSNHIVDDAAMFPDYEFRLRHMPEAQSAAEGYQYLYFPRMAIYKNADDDQAELAGSVLTFCTSNVEMQQIVGLTMGVPPNPRVAEEYAEVATAEELEMLELVAEDRDVDRRPRYEAPPGTNTWRDVLRRQLEQVTNGNRSITEAAEATISEIDSGIQG
ncbi:ABC transporter substrate-binding protein [Nesterenkonia xinjiangensis]|uniref:ABC-type glycerol-3-phosphate transport system substrate-binding protein n=1 Tax=Nesterenkonia xinjiangensis TaxID=225327 RepID=A0A7Z0GNB4_9MICC|nr:extracellular solute-binding protein [Nesterenkonia xinjiangensis]NYJ79077.1 ABC-type glycerol-3-phosphate transport system substrate-binding protein [Nesterenkonia xinjiangensis]